MVGTIDISGRPVQTVHFSRSCSAAGSVLYSNANSAGRDWGIMISTVRSLFHRVAWTVKRWRLRRTDPFMYK